MNLAKINSALDEHIEGAESLSDLSKTSDLLLLKLDKLKNVVATTRLLEDEDKSEVMDLTNVKLGEEHE